MKKYRVTYEWSGYSRGFATHIVDAKTEEEAKEYWWSGKEFEREIVRDDTECDHDSIVVQEILDPHAKQEVK